MVLSGIEPLLGTICCSVPALKRLYSRVFGSLCSIGGSHPRSGSRSRSRSGSGHVVAMPLRRSKPPKTTEPMEEFRPDIPVPLHHKFQSAPNNCVTIETDRLGMGNEPAPGQITVRTEYIQTVVERGRQGGRGAEGDVF